MGARADEDRRPPRGEGLRAFDREDREDREPLAERARDVRGEADVRDAMARRLPGKSLKTLQSHAQHPFPLAASHVEPESPHEPPRMTRQRGG